MFYVVMDTVPVRNSREFLNWARKISKCEPDIYEVGDDGSLEVVFDHGAYGWLTLVFDNDNNVSWDRDLPKLCGEFVWCGETSIPEQVVSTACRKRAVIAGV